MSKVKFIQVSRNASGELVAAVEVTHSKLWNDYRMAMLESLRLVKIYRRNGMTNLAAFHRGLVRGYIAAMRGIDAYGARSGMAS